MIEHRANMRALADAGCQTVMAVCSVGAIRFPLVRWWQNNTSISPAKRRRSTMMQPFASVTEPFDAS